MATAILAKSKRKASGIRGTQTADKIEWKNHNKLNTVANSAHGGKYQSKHYAAQYKKGLALEQAKKEDCHEIKNGEYVEQADSFSTHLHHKT
jgi:hypothetical protein